MKILVLSRDVRHVGGVVNFINVLIKNLSNRVHFNRQFIGKRIGSRGHLFELLYPILDSVKLIKTIIRNNYDLVHLNPSMNKKSIFREGLFIVALRMAGFKKIVVLWHGWDQNLVNRIKANVIYRLIFKNIFRKASMLLVLANYFRNDLIQMGIPSAKVKVTTTMFDKNIFNFKGKDKKQSESNLLFLSRLSKDKGVYELLNAFKIVSSKYPKTHLVIAGDGPEFLPMKHHVESDSNLKNNVFFAGYVKDLEKGKVFMSSGVFVFPTYHGEGCPVSLLEAMAAGLAVITTPVGAIPDIVENNVNGILLSDMSPNKIAEAICKFIENKDFFNSVKANNRLKAWRNYEAGIVSNAMLDVYKNVISG